MTNKKSIQCTVLSIIKCVHVYMALMIREAVILTFYSNVMQIGSDYLLSVFSFNPHNDLSEK